ncbi:MAG: bifunctional diaminohydroxyphosphoribosylaminopyrimidine deaminase/5-amino-6-(5-phosphoribosylamino)uracil reductase RibD [Chitinophagaceae bacterium]|nr:bifunctional diaminohydroxyphosphoribosylaminopyrimidine deaminase/5-amino-6-(5-phosphoribosylamino)uracil reductase RibD [Chitinophagaceae bacterium]
MQRCLQLAKLGAGNVAPNPMVGSVLVHDDIIIGEGYHQQYGRAHAEVNCINSVSNENKTLIKNSTLYVSLEPCAHFGKTPPCADLIVAHKIPRLVIGCRDSYKEVNGKGIAILKTAGVEVMVGILEQQAKEINRRFITYHEKGRPYIILKWAQSSNLQIANADLSRVLISNEFTNRLVHQWRSEEASIMVGTNTALYDDPSLTNRYWQGKNPVRIVIDKTLKIPSTHQLLSGGGKTIVFNSLRQEESGTVIYRRINTATDVISQVLDQLYQMKIQSVLVEGGSKLLQSFIDGGCWDEARVITNGQLVIEDGVPAPVLCKQSHIRSESLLSDSIQYYKSLPLNN